MDMTYLESRTFSSLTNGRKKENGLWEVSVVMTESISYPSGLVREEQIEGKAEDKDFDMAHKTAMRDVLQKLQDLVYSRGFDSLIEGKDYERSLEENNDFEIKADEAPKSE